MAEQDRQILEAVLRFLYDHWDGSAEICNLWEQVHTLMGCKECQKRWDGTARREREVAAAREGTRA